MPDWSPWFRLVIAVLATWRVARLIAYEDGPFDVIVRLRGLAGSGVLGRLMDCPHCLGLWIAAPAALLLSSQLPDWCAAWLAVSGGASLVETLARRADASHPAPAEPTIPATDGGPLDALLRTEASRPGESERSGAHDPAA